MISSALIARARAMWRPVVNVRHIDGESAGSSRSHPTAAVLSKFHDVGDRINCGVLCNRHVRPGNALSSIAAALPTRPAITAPASPPKTVPSGPAIEPTTAPVSAPRARRPCLPSPQQRCRWCSRLCGRDCACRCAMTGSADSGLPVLETTVQRPWSAPDRACPTRPSTIRSRRAGHGELRSQGMRGRILHADRTVDSYRPIRRWLLVRRGQRDRDTARTLPIRRIHRRRRNAGR